MLFLNIDKYLTLGKTVSNLSSKLERNADLTSHQVD
jgi:hypothetical protein